MNHDDATAAHQRRIEQGRNLPPPLTPRIVFGTLLMWTGNALLAIGILAIVARILSALIGA